MKEDFEKLPYKAKVEDLEITDENRAHIEKFITNQKGHISEARRKKYKYSLLRFAYLIEKDFAELTKEDMHQAAGLISASKSYGVKTKFDFIGDVKRVFKVLFGDYEEYPECIKGLKLPKKLRQKGVLALPEKMLSEEDVIKQVKACPNNRDKFLISFIGLDAGIRPIEAYRLTWGQIKRDKYGHYVKIITAKRSGDQETRIIRIIKSEPYFKKWLSEYPKIKTDQDYVFINYQNYEQFNDAAFRELLKRIKKRTGWKDRLYPYLYRHSLITRMSKDPNVSISVLKRFVGHAQRSDIIGEYQHFNNDDLRDMQLKYNGKIKSKEIQDEKKIEPIKCPSCKTANEFDAEFCSNNKCNMALSQKRTVEIFEDKKNMKEDIDTLKEMVRTLMKEKQKRTKAKWMQVPDI